ncbi:MAG: hypothetical protein JW818_02085 [Pirellulales bacterium]|nr:hypothetical protein [Pirellulales bacterium]
MTPVDAFDARRFQMAGPQLPCPPQRPKAPRHKPGNLFLKGPIPWSWLEKAMRLPGKALAVALVVWHLCGLKKSSTVHMEPSKIRSAGMSPRVARRGLKSLENAGLVAVDRHPGRAPDVTIQQSA